MRCLKSAFIFLNHGIKQMKKTLNPLLFGCLIVFSIAFSGSAKAADGDVPADVTNSVNETTATVKALGPIALAAISVALVPFGAGMALSFVHKVMSKA